MTRSLLLALCCLCGTAVAQEQPPVRAPFFQGASLPAPPGQNLPWAHGDDELSRVAAILFELGLADPRGLEYRELEIAVGSPWNGGGFPVKTSGWVLPAKDGEGRFAVAWNGLVYPVLSVGNVGDVRRDWAGAAELLQQTGQPQQRIVFEQLSVLPSPPTALKLLMLMRLGEVELVNRLAPLILRESAANPYLGLASEWTWFAFERAVCAHARGDDRLCLVDAQLLTRVQPLIEAEARRRGFEQTTDHSNSRFTDRKLPYLPFLKQLPLLLADSQRRVDKPGQAPPANSIAALIDDLQNVDARQRDQPGGVTLALDPRVQALVKRGNEIVEPLFDALEHDTRLTRSISFGRDFHRDRHLISVSDAALATLRDHLQVNFKTYGENGEPLSRRELAQTIRDYWTKMGNLPQVERFYGTLKDDKASPELWLQAAAFLARPTNVEAHGAWTVTRPLGPDEKIVLRGESLRDGRSPTVSQLLAKRSDDIAAIRTRSTRDQFLYIDAGTMALHLADWDPAVATPVLKRRLQRAWNIGAEPGDILAFNGNPVERFAYIIARMTIARARCGDQTAYDEYAAWIQKADLNGLGTVCRDLQKPLSEGADHPAIAAAIDVLFNDPKSSWSQITARGNGSWLRDFWSSSLPNSAGFRKQALRGLADKSPAGTIKRSPAEPGNSGSVTMFLAGGGFGMGAGADDPERLQPGEERAFRVCDTYAWIYSKYHQGPRFELDWPEEKRDAGIEKCREWLEARGAILK